MQMISNSAGFVSMQSGGLRASLFALLVTTFASTLSPVTAFGIPGIGSRVLVDKSILAAHLRRTERQSLMQCNIAGGEETQLLQVVGAVMEDNNRILMAQRPRGKRYGGLWEFPGGKVEAGETDQEALARECMEELDVEVRVGELLGSGTDGTVDLRCYQVEIISGEMKMLEHQDMQWFQRDKLPFDQTPPADIPILEALVARGQRMRTADTQGDGGCG